MQKKRFSVVFSMFVKIKRGYFATNNSMLLTLALKNSLLRSCYQNKIGKFLWCDCGEIVLPMVLRSFMSFWHLTPPHVVALKSLQFRNCLGSTPLHIAVDILSITCSLHVFTNSESTNPRIFFRKIFLFSFRTR